MSDTLKNRTAKSALFIVRESLRSLRQYSADLSDPANITRIISEAQILSTSLKKLEKFLDVPTATDHSIDLNSRENELIDVRAVNRVLTAVHEGKLCPTCGGLQ